MSVDRLVFAIAGIFIMVSLALGMPMSPIFHHEYWLFFTAFVGVNLFQSAFTGFCPMVIMLKALGVKPGQAFS